MASDLVEHEGKRPKFLITLDGVVPAVDIPSF